MAAISLDKILLGAASALVVGAGVWMVLQPSKFHHKSLSTASTTVAYQPIGVDAPKVTTSTWPPAPEQSTGKNWIFDVFTPPEIYYYPDTKKFEIKRVVLKEDPIPKPPEPFGVKLKEVKPDVFRLQLVGYVGKSDSEYRGNFENTLSGKTIIGGAGKEFPDLGLKVKTFDVKRKVTTIPGRTPIIDIEAIAVVVDVKTGDEITLTNKRRYVQGEPFAIFTPEGSEEPIRKKAGETFSIGDLNYTIESIVVEPPSAVVRKEGPKLEKPVTETLTPFVPSEQAPQASPPPASAPEQAPVGATFPGL